MKRDKILSIIFAILALLLTIVFVLVSCIYKRDLILINLMYLILLITLFLILSVNRSLNKKSIEINNLKNDILELKKRIGNIKE